MARSNNEGGTRSRGWASSTGTKAQVLDAAVEIFSARGYTETTMAEIVERSGVSVGSIYHHFGGKSEVFLAIWLDLIEQIDERASEAADRARAAGIVEPMALFGVGTRAYMELLWENKSRARVVAMGDTPPGFDAIRRDHAGRGSVRDIGVLGLGTSRKERLLQDFLLAMRAESARVALKCKTKGDLDEAIDTTLEYIACLDPAKFRFGAKSSD